MTFLEYMVRNLCESDKRIRYRKMTPTMRYLAHVVRQIATIVETYGLIVSDVSVRNRLRFACPAESRRIVAYYASWKLQRIADNEISDDFSYRAVARVD